MSHAISIAAIIAACAAALGTYLAVRHGRPGPRPGWRPAALHGGLGLAAFVVLLAGLRGPAPRTGTGSGQFGLDAALLFGLALLSGLFPIAARLRRRPVSGLVLGLHATFAVMGLVVLLAFL
jgi:hypothetical protein